MAEHRLSTLSSVNLPLRSIKLDVDVLEYRLAEDSLCLHQLSRTYYELCPHIRKAGVLRACKKALSRGPD